MCNWAIISLVRHRRLFLNECNSSDIVVRVCSSYKQNTTKFHDSSTCIMLPFALLPPLPVFSGFHTLHKRQMSGACFHHLLCMYIYGFYWRQNNVAVRDLWARTFQSVTPPRLSTRQRPRPPGGMSPGPTEQTITLIFQPDMLITMGLLWCSFFII